MDPPRSKKALVRAPFLFYSIFTQDLNDTDAYFIKTDAPNGFKHFVRAPLTTGMEGDFDTGNMRYKARERYSFGFSDPRCVYGSQGS